MQYNFKIRFNTEFHKAPGKYWRVLINDVEHLVCDVQIKNLEVKTISHTIPTGEKKWSIYCESDKYMIDDKNKLIIF